MLTDREIKKIRATKVTPKCLKTRDAKRAIEKGALEGLGYPSKDDALVSINNKLGSIDKNFSIITKNLATITELLKENTQR